jgi:hypothetical protein
MVVAQLGEPGFDPPKKVKIIFVQGNQGIASTSGGTITCWDGWFKKHPDDTGAVIHELCHVVQRYTRPNTPVWVTEGIADYVRWYCFEPVEKHPHRDPSHAKYTDSYQTTAQFFDWIVRTKDKKFIQRLNAAARAGNYAKDRFKDYTDSSLDDLWDEYVRTWK